MAKKSLSPKSNGDNIIIIVDFSTGRAVSDCDSLGKILYTEPAVAKKLLASPDESSVSYFGNPECLDRQLLDADLIDEADEIIKIKKKYTVNRQITDTGRLCAAYYLSPSLPYYMFGFKPIQKIEELPLIWQTYGLRVRDGSKFIDSLLDPAFSYWLWHRDPEMALKVRNMQERKASSGEIAYTMFPGMSYNFKVNKDLAGRIDTPKKIGEDLNAKVADYITNRRAISSTFIDFGLDKGGSVDGYFRSNVIFAPQRNSFNRIFHNRKEWANGKYSPYNPYVSLFSFIKALGCKPYYQFSDGTKIFDLEQLKSIPATRIEQALNSGYLSAWIATFFQEDPGKVLNDEVDYAKEALKFTNFIESICPSYLPVVKYNKSIQEIDDTAKKIRRTTRFSFISLLLKLIFVPATFLMFLLAILLTFEFKIPDYNIIEHHFFGFSLVIGLPVFIFVLATGRSFYGGLIFGAIGGLAGAWILKFLMGYISPYLTWVYLAIILAAFIYFIVKLWRVYERVPDYAYVIDIGHPDFKLREMNALRYAYGSKSINERGDEDLAVYLRCYKSNRKSAQKSQFLYVCGGIATAFFLIIGLYFLSPAFGEEHSLMYDSQGQETVETEQVEAVQPDKPKVKKKSSRKSKVKSEDAATDENSESVNSDIESSSEEIEEVKNEDRSITDVL